MKKYRRKQKEYVCDECGKDFDKQSQIKKHKIDAHASIWESEGTKHVKAILRA